MSQNIDTVVVGGGQAGLAMSEHLSKAGIEHVIFERDRIAQRWRTARWDSLVMNGPAWHDRFPSREFVDSKPDDFPGKDSVVAYFEQFAEQINAPIRCGVEVKSVRPEDGRFSVETTNGNFSAVNVVAATGPFQVPSIPPVVPELPGLMQMHSTGYKNPNDLTDGAVLVVGAGSSGTQIADELLSAGRTVYLSIGAHDRPPRQYRGKDFVWWLGVLGKWQMKTPPAGKEHVTIAVSGANGGKTVDFRELAERGMRLLGMTQQFEHGVLSFAPDLAENIRQGDENYLSLLAEADAYIEQNGLDFPEEPHAKEIGPDPKWMSDPLLELDLAAAGIKTIIWATGFTQDFSWLKTPVFDKDGNPQHNKGVTEVPGIYFLGLPWLSMRGSSFIWGVWEDAKFLASHIADRSSSTR